MTIIKCNLCGGEVKLFHPKEIYGPRYKHVSDPKDIPGKPVSYIYSCLDCKARVGCHKDTKEPLGQLADKETRKARSMCHMLVDPIRKKSNGSKSKKRKKIYKLLSEHMGKSIDETHFGMFTIEECREAYAFILNYKKEKGINL